jgi:hypothetical protein
MFARIKGELSCYAVFRRSSTHPIFRFPNVAGAALGVGAIQRTAFSITRRTLGSW